MKYFLVILLIAVSVQAQTYRKAIHLCRSVGRIIYNGEDGATNNAMNQIHQYNVAHSLTGADSCSMVNGYPFPSSNNTLWSWWDEWENPNSDLHDDYLNTSTYSVIIIKECFASQSNIDAEYASGKTCDSDTNNTNQTVCNYKWHYRKILGEIAKHTDKFFVWWNIPPMVEGSISEGDATRLKRFNTWVTDTLAMGLDSYGAVPENVYFFDYYYYMTNSEASLYQPDEWSDVDSHPGGAGADHVLPYWITQTFDAAIAYEGAEEDTMPTLSTFTPITGAELNSWHLSNGSLVGDLTDSCTVYAAGDSFKVNSGAMRITRTKVYNGDYLYLSGFASGINSTKVTKTITAGSTSRDFDITTKSAGIVATMPLIRSANGKPIYDKNGKALWK